MKTRTNTVGEVRVVVLQDLGSGAHPPPVACPHCEHPQIPAGRDDVLPRRHCIACENVDPERVAWLLAGLLGEMPEPDVVELCSSATLGDAVEACRVVEAERRGEEIVSGPPQATEAPAG